MEIGASSFSDWQRGAVADTRAITLPGKVNYQLDVAAKMDEWRYS